MNLQINPSPDEQQQPVQIFEPELPLNVLHQSQSNVSIAISKHRSRIDLDQINEPTSVANKESEIVNRFSKAETFWAFLIIKAFCFFISHRYFMVPTRIALLNYLWLIGYYLWIIICYNGKI